MPDNEINDNNKRPKRRAAQKTYQYHENTSVWSEEKDLKKALLASLQDVKRSASKTQTICVQNVKNNSGVNENIDRSSVYSKLNTHNSSQPIVCKESPLIGENNCSLLSLAAHRRARVSAQRKFAQSSGSNNNSPVSTPIKIGFVPPANVVELFPNQKPKTEDFLTFLCLRRSPILPPNLDFVRLNSGKKVNNDEKGETDSENISCDEYEHNINDKYTICRLRNTDRRGSGSSNVSKTTSLSSKASLQVSNSKKSDFQKIENKGQNVLRHKRSQSNCSDSGLKNYKEISVSHLKQSHSKKSGLKSTIHENEFETKSFNTLKEKYKQQRIVKKSNNPSKSIKKNNSKNINSEDRNKSNEFEGIQTRQRLRSYSYNEKEVKSDTKSSNSSNITQRVLRSHHSGICTHSLPSLSSTLLIHKMKRKKLKSYNSSQIGIRPQKRKAKPVVPLIDYYFDSEFDSDSSKINIKSNQKKISNSSELKTKKSLSEDNKTKKIFPKSLTIDKGMRTPGRPKGSTKTANKAKASLNSQPRRLTRSSRPLSPPTDSKALEREQSIKQQIIEIEKKHKRLRRFPSDQSLHSSASSSSSSSESLPNSSSSSSSINIPRLTRSLEHLKKIRDIAAKLKKEQNKKRKEDKKKNKSQESVPKFKEKCVKRKKREKVVDSVKDESLNKDSKSIDKRKKSLTKLKNRSIVRRVSESVMTATSDTDCDTEAPDRQVEANESEFIGTEDSMASILGEDMERASIVMQDMAEEINTLLVDSGTDLEYGSTEHIQGLMTSEFSGAFSEETVTTASAILLPSGSNSSFNYIQHMDHTTQTRSTVDASTNTTEDDILASFSSDDTQTSIKYDYTSKQLSVGTQTPANSSAQTDGLLV